MVKPHCPRALLNHKCTKRLAATIQAALLALALAACGAGSPLPEETPPAAAPPLAPSEAAPRGCPDDPDRDHDGVPDRCDACPMEPGMLWDDFPIVDGCSSGPFHHIVRDVEARERALGKPSPCGRMPGSPRSLPPPPCP
jgi:hypothetical protein